MADWNLPTLPDTYANFLDRLNARDVDSGTLVVGTITNPPVGMMRYERIGNKFQEWNGSAWVDKIISTAGGGTGGTSLPVYGTMASQNANNVAITGGNINSLSSLSVNGATTVTTLDVNSTLTTGSLNTPLTDVSGRIPAIDSTRFSSLSGANLTGIPGNQISGAISGSQISGPIPYASVPDLDASKIVSGQFPAPRLGSGTANFTTFLRGDGTWQEVSMVRRIVSFDLNVLYTSGAPTNRDFALPFSFDNYLNVLISFLGSTFVGFDTVRLVSNNVIRFHQHLSTLQVVATIQFIEYKNIG
jgi:hypothetical protein